jgi:hypothetical protein
MRKPRVSMKLTQGVGARSTGNDAVAHRREHIEPTSEMVAP